MHRNWSYAAGERKWLVSEAHERRRQSQAQRIPISSTHGNQELLPDVPEALDANGHDAGRQGVGSEVACRIRKPLGVIAPCSLGGVCHGREDHN
jgi:hypothetical protein